ncbi:MAG: MATE family efflux transporter [Oscillospiraceae bacterium]|nr:MATE family efflux transporter [Oscillospiraceae bacterium]
MDENNLVTQQKDDLFKRFFSMFWLLVLQNVVTISVNLADNMMLGAYSEASLSGVASINQVQFVLQMLLAALGDGVVMFSSQYWGKKEHEPIRKVAAIGLRAGLCVAIVLFLATTITPAGVMHLFTNETAIVTEGVKYLSVIRFSYLFFAVSMLLLATMRSIEIVGIAFRLSIMALFVNCGINYVLIYGHFGAPELGVVGAAIGTLTSRVLECAVVLWYVLFHQKKVHFSAKDIFSRDADLSRRYLKAATPMVVLQGAWGLNIALQTIILGHMTPAAIAANSAASTLYMLSKSAAVGAAATTATIIGKSIGAGDLEKTKEYSKRLQKLFVVIGLCAGVFLFFVRIPVLKVYQLSDEAMQLANSFLIVLSFIVATMSYQMPTNNGIVKGGGDVNFVVKMDFISIWCIVIPVSLIMAFVVKASPLVVVCCLNADQAFKCIPAFIHCNYGNWIRKLT